MSDYLLSESIPDEGFYEDLARITRENRHSLPNLTEILDAVELTINQYKEELLYDLQGIQIEKLTAKVVVDPDSRDTIEITTSENPNRLSRILVPHCFESFIRISEDFETRRIERKPTLREMLACVAYSAINQERYVADAPNKLYIRNIEPEVIPAPPPPPKVQKPIVLASYPPAPEELGYLIFPNLADYLTPETLEEALTLDSRPYTTSDAREPFLGFSQAPPGLHHLTVEPRNELIDRDPISPWFYLQPSQVLVLELKSLRYTYRKLRWFEASPETTAYYQNLADTGALESALVTYFKSPTHEKPWYKSQYPWSLITQHIRPPHFLPNIQIEQLGKEVEGLKIQDSHQGDLMAFLAEFEFAFASYYASYEDLHLERWNQLLQVLCLSGLAGIASLGEQLPTVVDILMVQLNRLSDYNLVARLNIFETTQHWSQKLTKSGLSIAVEKGQELAASIENRKELLAEIRKSKETE